MKNNKNSSGYTLLELAIVVSLISLVSLVAGPDMLEAAQQVQYRRTVEDAVGTLRTLRAEAITSQRTVGVGLNPFTGQFYTAYDDDGDGTIEAGEWRSLNKHINHSNVDGTPLPVGQFNSRGMFSASSGAWQIRLPNTGGNDKYLYVFPSGHITLSDIALP